VRDATEAMKEANPLSLALNVVRKKGTSSSKGSPEKRQTRGGSSWSSREGRKACVHEFMFRSVFNAGKKSGPKSFFSERRRRKGKSTGAGSSGTVGGKVPDSPRGGRKGGNTQKCELGDARKMSLLMVFRKD